jgi:LysM repeat protein
MNKKNQIIIISAAVVFTAFFVWFAMTTSNTSTVKNTDDKKSISLGTEEPLVPQNNLEGATIIDNSNKANNSTDSYSSETNRDSGKVDKTTNGSSSTNPENPANKVSEKDTNTVSTSAEAIADLQEYTLYEVKQGESLSSVCKQFLDTSPAKVTAKAILAANKLSTSSEIKPGMKIKIPSKYSNGSKYTILSGDSLYTIASEYMDDKNIYDAIEKIKKDNFLSSDNIKVGDELFLAGVSNLKNSTVNLQNNKSTTVNSNKAPDTKEENPDEKYVSYAVKKGETLLSICKQYEQYCPVSIASKTILKINKFSTSSEIKEGITIKIPEQYFSKGEKYTIKYGDSLSQIAITHMKSLEMYKAIEKIMKDNFKTNQDIRIGEEIFIASTDL